MNIFYLESDPDRCAEAHVDKHCSKMILESAQLLSDALWVNDVLGYVPRKLTKEERNEISNAYEKSGNFKSHRYKCFNPSHPSSIWTRTSLENWEWLWVLSQALEEELRWRGFNSHKSAQVIRNMSYPDKMLSLGFSPPLLAMPEEYKQDNAIQAYRAYYRGDKDHLALYTRRTPPEWWHGEWKNFEGQYSLN